MDFELPGSYSNPSLVSSKGGAIWLVTNQRARARASPNIHQSETSAIPNHHVITVRHDVIRGQSPLGG